MNKHWMTAVALAAAAGAASAQQAYVEASGGVTSALGECGDGVSCDKTDVGGKVLAGYGLTPELSIEGGYLNLGRVSATFDAGLGQDVTTRIRSKAWYLGGAWRVATGRPELSLMLRAGMARVTSRETVSSPMFDGETATDWRPLAGVAMRYHLTPELALVAAADITRSAKLEVGSGNIRLFSLGAQYSFDPLTVVGAVGAVGGAVSAWGSEAQASWAQGPRRHYAYATLGSTHSDALDPLKRDQVAGRYEMGRRPLGLRLGVGRRWGPVWSTELALTHYGKSTFKSAAGTSPEASGSVSAAGLAALSAWRARTEMNLTWVVRAGASYNWARAQTREGTAAQQTDRRNLAPMFGLGLEYPIDKDTTFMVSGDITRIRVGGELPNVKYYAAGVGVRF